MRLYEIVGVQYSELCDTIFGQFLTNELAEEAYEELPEEIQYETEIRRSNLELNTIETDGVVKKFPQKVNGFDIALLEKPGNNGLSLLEVAGLYAKLNDTEGFPVELGDDNGNSFALGFITPDAAETIQYSYDYGSELGSFVSSILGDMDKESADGTYEFLGLRIWLNRNFD